MIIIQITSNDSIYKAGKSIIITTRIIKSFRIVKFEKVVD